jgi:hypothetical protein
MMSVVFLLSISLLSSAAFGEATKYVYNWKHNGVESKSTLALEGIILQECRGIVDTKAKEAGRFFGFNPHIKYVRTENFTVVGTRSRNSVVDSNSFEAWGVVDCVYEFGQ